MEKKNLFNAVKTFINNTPVGETFTTKQLIASVGNQEEPSRIHITEMSSPPSWSMYVVP